MGSLSRPINRVIAHDEDSCVTVVCLPSFMDTSCLFAVGKNGGFARSGQREVIDGSPMLASTAEATREI